MLRIEDISFIEDVNLDAVEINDKNVELIAGGYGGEYSWYINNGYWVQGPGFTIDRAIANQYTLGRMQMGAMGIIPDPMAIAQGQAMGNNLSNYIAADLNNGSTNALWNVVSLVGSWR